MVAIEVVAATFEATGHFEKAWSSGLRDWSFFSIRTFGKASTEGAAKARKPRPSVSKSFGDVPHC
jgi:hypothetical protein